MPVIHRKHLMLAFKFLLQFEEGKLWKCHSFLQCFTFFQSPFRYLLSQPPCKVSFIISRWGRRHRWRNQPQLGLTPRILESESSYYNNSKHICSARDCPLGFAGVKSLNPHKNPVKYTLSLSSSFYRWVLFSVQLTRLIQTEEPGEIFLGCLFPTGPTLAWFLRMPFSLLTFQFLLWWFALLHAFTMHVLVLQSTIR